MENCYPDIKVLRQKITDELAKALGKSPEGWIRRLLAPIASPATQRFARLAQEFDRYVAKHGFCEACRWVLPRFIKHLDSIGVENVPREGPLLIASNHPGTVDFLAIAASLCRDDLKLVASSIPFIRNLPHTSQYLIFATPNTHERMNVVRSMIRSLEDGQALLIFPSGGIDPDPAVMPGAVESLDSWSPSIELILRRVPHVRLLITMVKGVLSSSFLRHPLTYIRAGIRDRQRIAEFLQVMQQMLFPQRLLLSPKVLFDKPLTKVDLMSQGKSKEIMDSIIQRAKLFLLSHLG